MGALFACSDDAFPGKIFEKMEFGLVEGFTINGVDVEIPDYLCSCPYLKSKFGSGKFEYSYNGETFTQWTYPASV